MSRFQFSSVYKTSARLLIVALMATSGVVVAAEQSGDNWHHDWDSAWDASQADGRPILIFVTKKCCYYCEKMKNDTYGNTRVVDEIQPRAVCGDIGAFDCDAFRREPGFAARRCGFCDVNVQRKRGKVGEGHFEGFLIAGTRGANGRGPCRRAPEGESDVNSRRPVCKGE